MSVVGGGWHALFCSPFTKQQMQWQMSPINGRKARKASVKCEWLEEAKCGRFTEKQNFVCHKRRKGDWFVRACEVLEDVGVAPVLVRRRLFSTYIHTHLHVGSGVAP